jgi:hypothetical protein
MDFNTWDRFNFQKAVEGTYRISLPELESNLDNFYKFFRKLALIAILVVAIIVAVLNIFGENIISIFINLSDPSTPLLDLGFTSIPAPLFVFRMATIGVIFHTTSILCYLGLMYLEEHSLNVSLMFFVLISNLVICPLLAIIFANIYFCIFGYIVSFAIGTIFGLQLIRRTINEFPFRAYAKLL